MGLAWGAQWGAQARIHPGWRPRPCSLTSEQLSSARAWGWQGRSPASEADGGAKDPQPLSFQARVVVSGAVCVPQKPPAVSREIIFPMGPWWQQPGPRPAQSWASRAGRARVESLLRSVILLLCSHNS